MHYMHACNVTKIVKFTHIVKIVKKVDFGPFLG